MYAESLLSYQLSGGSMVLKKVAMTKKKYENEIQFLKMRGLRHHWSMSFCTKTLCGTYY